MKECIIAIGIAAVMFFGINHAFAQTPGAGPGREGMQHHEHGYGPGSGWGHHEEGMRPGKDFFTPEQRATFRELRRKFKLENAQLIGALVAKRIELQALWADPKVDPKAITDKEKEFRDLQSQMRDKVVQLRLEGRKSLTPEQITKLGARFEMGHRFGRDHMMGRWGMMRGGEMVERGRMMGHRGMMAERGKLCCTEMMRPEHGMDMMKYRMGAMGGMGMCE